jgi:pSer/pThr/pTyr-binding forkhead associated (FHA) protein
MDDSPPPSDTQRKPLPDLPEQGETPPDFVPLRLVLQGGDMTISLSRSDMVFGRHSESDVRLPLPDVSRRHCRFVFSESRWQVFDLNSLNGVHINGERVQQATLTDKDMVRIGSFNFEVALPGGPTLARGTDQPTDLLQSIAEALPLPVPDSSSQKRQAS